MERKCRSRDEGFSNLVAGECSDLGECNNLRSVILKFGDKYINRRQLESVGLCNMRI